MFALKHCICLIQLYNDLLYNSVNSCITEKVKPTFEGTRFAKDMAKHNFGLLDVQLFPKIKLLMPIRLPPDT